MKLRDWSYAAAIVALCLTCLALSEAVSDLRRQVAALANPELPTRWEFATYSPGRPERPVRRWRGYTSSVVDGAATIMVDETPTIGGVGEVKP